MLREKIKTKIKFNPGKIYASFSIIMINIIIMIILINLIVLLFFKKNKKNINLIDIYGIEKLLKAYPEYNKNQLEDFIKDNERSTTIEFESFTQFRPNTLNTKYVNIDKNGFRLNGIKSPWPLEKNSFNIFLFGGSTAFGAGVEDKYTISSHLQDMFNKNKNVYVYNFARPSYFSTQERILFESLILNGYIPNIVIFIDGLNDFSNINGEPDNSYILSKSIKESYYPPSLSKRLLYFLESMPIVEVIKNNIKYQKELLNIKNKKKIKKEYNTNYENEIIIDKIINRVINNHRIIKSISNTYGIKPIFIWQPIPTFNYDLKYHIFYNGNFSYFRKHQRSKFGYIKIKEMILNKKFDENYLWLGDIQENYKKNLYIDSIHYTNEFSKDIASYIFDFINKKNYLKKYNK